MADNEDEEGFKTFGPAVFQCHCSVSVVFQCFSISKKFTPKRPLVRDGVLVSLFQICFPVSLFQFSETFTKSLWSADVFQFHCFRGGFAISSVSAYQSLSGQP